MDSPKLMWPLGAQATSASTERLASLDSRWDIGVTTRRELQKRYKDWQRISPNLKKFGYRQKSNKISAARLPAPASP
jgi:hypothetical protein